MEIFHSIKSIQEYLKKQKKVNEHKIGFVPTMGALHKGHLSLIETAKKDTDIVVCSIFVNPIQFNNKEDLKNYPRNVDKDIKLLKAFACDVLFLPSEEEMYPFPDNTVFDFGQLDKVMEGEYRPGHFNGVAIVVKKLFEIVSPDIAYFGEKDYQQLVIIKELTRLLDLPVKIITCPTLREEDGLAMSSRNILLSPEERKIAAFIPRILFEVQKKAESLPVNELKAWTEKQFKSLSLLQLEYFEIADTEILQPVKDWSACNGHCRGFIAVKVGKIRLIDNIPLKRGYTKVSGSKF